MLSAVEGVNVATDALKPYVLPIAAVILFALFNVCEGWEPLCRFPDVPLPTVAFSWRPEIARRLTFHNIPSATNIWTLVALRYSSYPPSVLLAWRAGRRRMRLG